jgi:hypothetical protein
VVAGQTFAISTAINFILVISVPIPVAVPTYMLPGAMAGLTAFAASSARALSEFRVDDYKKILAIVCEEASKWSTSEPTSPVDANWENDVLEKELQNRGQPIPVWIFALVHQCLQGSLF